MKSKALIASATAALALVGTSTTAFAAGSGSGSSGATSPSKARSCDADAHWPAYVQGRPDGFDARDDGVYLWHNPSGGWGLRVSHPVLADKASKVVFTGAITSKGTIGHLVKARDEKNDVVKVGPNGHTLYFRFVNFGGVDGVDFTTACTPGLKATFKADGSSMPTGLIHLGDHKVNPDSNPFLIRRRDSDTGTSSPGTGSGPAPSAAAPAPNAPAAGSSGSGGPAPSQSAG